MPYATSTDVAVQLGRPAASAAEGDQWDAWLATAERDIRRLFTRAGFDLDMQIGINEPTAAEVADVEVAAVIRKIQNPISLETSYTKSLDDGSVTRRREGAADTNPLDITDADIFKLLPIRRSNAFSTRPGFQPDHSCRGRSW